MDFQDWKGWPKENQSLTIPSSIDPKIGQPFPPRNDIPNFDR